MSFEFALVENPTQEDDLVFELEIEPQWLRIPQTEEEERALGVEGEPFFGATALEIAKRLGRRVVVTWPGSHISTFMTLQQVEEELAARPDGGQVFMIAVPREP